MLSKDKNVNDSQKISCLKLEDYNLIVVSIVHNARFTCGACACVDESQDEFIAVQWYLRLSVSLDAESQRYHRSALNSAVFASSQT